MGGGWGDGAGQLMANRLNNGREIFQKAFPSRQRRPRQGSKRVLCDWVKGGGGRKERGTWCDG